MGLRAYSVKTITRSGPYATLILSGEVEPSRPGQFYMLRGDWGADPLLGRPLSVLAEDLRGGSLSFLLKVVGEGTRRLAEVAQGDTVFGLGPLGRPFPLPEGDAPVAMVGGGVGMPPLVFLAGALRERETPPLFFQGARSRSDLLLLQELEALGIHPVLATEDGSAGTRGLATDPLPALVEDGGCGTVYACGPEGMLEAVARICRGKVPCHLSLEARMGCGYGVCLGCVVPVEREGRKSYERVCKEGPVFDGEVVLWR